MEYYILFCSLMVIGPLFLILAVTLWIFRPMRKAERDKKAKPDS